MTEHTNNKNGRGTASAPTAGSVSKRWKIKRWILEEYEEYAPDRKTALDQCYAEGDPKVFVTKETCVEIKLNRTTEVSRP